LKTGTAPKSPRLAISKGVKARARTDVMLNLSDGTKRRLSWIQSLQAAGGDEADARGDISLSCVEAAGWPGPSSRRASGLP